MTSEDEQFFESLASGEKSSSDDEPEAELARASTAASRTRTSRASSPRVEAHAAERTDWSDGEPEGQLTVDVYQTPDDIFIESAIAGVRPEDIDIDVTSDSIVIRGAREHERRASDEDYLYQECYWGRFARSIILPQEVDPESAEVTFKNGILTVKLPKLNKRKTRKLRVKAD